MPSWCIDPINGDNANSGDSWTVNYSGSDGQTYGTTKFTAASAPFSAGDVGKYIRMQGTVYKIVAFVSATEVTLDRTYATGTGRTYVQGGPVQNPTYVNYTNYPNTSASDVLKHPKVTTYDAGDVSLTEASALGTISSGRVQLLEECESGWTASANITADYNTTYEFAGSAALRILPATAFTTGKAAYKALAGGPLDLSGFQGLSFCLYVGGSIAAASLPVIKLCSDTTGDTPVDTFDIAAAYGELYTYGNTIVPITIQTGAALGSSIQSIAIYFDADPGTTAFYFDNFCAVLPESNADHLCHSCLIATEDQANADWYAVLAFESSTSMRLYSEWQGATETPTNLYRHHPRFLDGKNNAYPNGGGISEYPWRAQGGWDTGSDTLTGFSSYSMWSGASSDNACFSVYDHGRVERMVTRSKEFGYYSSNYVNDVGWLGICCSGWSYQAGVDSPLWYQYFSGWTQDRHPGTFILEDVHAVGRGSAVFQSATQDPFGTWRNMNHDLRIDGLYCRGVGLMLQGWSRVRGENIYIKGCSADNGHANASKCGLVLSGYNQDVRLYNVSVEDGAYYGVYSYVPGDVTIHKLFTDGNGSAGIYQGAGVLKVYDADLNEGTPYAFPATYASAGRIVLVNYQGTPSNHLIASPLGNIEDEATVRHIASGISWKMTPNADTTDMEGVGLLLHVADVLVTAGVEHSWTIWLRRTSTAVTGKFFVPASVAGITAEVSDSIGAAIDTWEQQTITFTPTDTAVVPVFVLAHHLGTGQSLYVDDFDLGA